MHGLYIWASSVRCVWFAKRGIFALSLALDDADHNKLVDAVDDFAPTRAPLFDANAR